LSWAHVLTRDPREADVLVRETLVVARRGDEGPRDAESVRIWLHRLLRRRFHSVERDRNFRRSRSNPISAVGYARERVTLTEIAPGTAAAG
jgi:DNA-directed RNA polymerase specialized sigma24 family protein